MTRVTVDLTTGATLQNLPEGSEICNPAGQLLGYF